MGISDDFDGRDLYVGDRVVVRYLLGEDTPADWRGDSAAAQSDVTGFLISGADPSEPAPLILDRDGVELSVPRERITSVRQLSYRAVRNKEIRALETAAADAWPGAEHAEIDGWRVRAGGGVSRRANSAVPLSMSANVSSLPTIGAWYSERGLPLQVAAPERLLGPRELSGTPTSAPVHVLVCDMAASVSQESTRVRLLDAPTPEWLRAYRGDDVDVAAAGTVVSAVLDGEAVFAEVVGDDGLLAIGRAAVTEAPDGTRWLGLSALWTSPAARRQGLSREVMQTLIAWGAERGATRIYVQAEASNRVAGTWYRRAGFALHHTYRYLTP